MGDLTGTMLGDTPGPNGWDEKSCTLGTRPARHEQQLPSMVVQS